MVKEVVYYILHALALKEEGDDKLAIGEKVFFWLDAARLPITDGQQMGCHALHTIEQRLSLINERSPHDRYSIQVSVRGVNI